MKGEHPLIIWSLTLMPKLCTMTRRFAYTGGLMACDKSDSDHLIKPQGVVSKITMSEARNPKHYERPNVLEVVFPGDDVILENDY